MRWIAGLALLLTACGSASTGTAQSSLSSRLKAAGINCHGQRLVGDVDCTFHGKKATVTTGKWSATEKTRKQACRAGYVNKGYVVATDDKSVAVAADQNATTQAIAKAMKLKVERYCPS